LLTNFENMPQKSNIYFFFQSNSVSLKDRKRLKSFIKYIFKSENRKVRNINLVFCSDKEILRINQLFLNHDYYTDIITFNLTNNSKIIDAEIYISLDRVRENANVLEVTFKSELHRVIFHGVLHLCGYKDKKMIEMRKMRNKEDFYLTKYFN
jgi:probable rRNA maturation factor